MIARSLLMTANSPMRKFARADGAEIAYHLTPGAPPGVVFLTGFRSDMTGDKATTLEAFCRDRGQAYLRFDYTGHGASSGEFTEGTIGQWAEDAIFAVDELIEGPLLLVGSSMGGWIMLLAALARRERVAGLVGIAAAPDFTEDLIWEPAAAELREQLVRTGVHYEASAYDEEPTPITLRLIEDGRRHLLLRGRIELDCPVRLLHGVQDPDVPWPTAQRLAAALASDDVEVTLIKSGDHRLSEPRDLERLKRVVGALSDEIAAAGG